MSEKYIVFKRDEFVEWLQQHTAADQAMNLPDHIGDVWVTRVQDRFATVVGFAYSNAIQNAIDVLDTIPDLADIDITRNRLKKILEAANDFAMKAQLATMNRKTKLPD